MKKAVILTFVFVMLLGMSAFATQTRTLVMGNNNTIMMDDANIWLFPARINNYGNLATGEFSQLSDMDDFYNFGINWKFGETKPWVLGTYFSTMGNFAPRTYTGVALGSYGLDYVAKPASLIYEPSLNNRSFDLLYGRQLGGFLFGFGFGYNHAGVTHDTNDFKQTFSQYIFSLGLTDVNGTWDLGAEFGLGSFTNEDAAGTTISEPDGFTDISVRGRYMYKYNQTLTFVPHAEAMFGSRGESITGAPEADYKESRTAFELGAGMNYTPVTNVLAVLDFGFQYEKIKFEEGTAAESNETTTHLPYFRVGLEGEVFSWMDVRLGAINNWEHFTMENNFKTSVFDNSTYLGVGLNFNRLHLDTYMDPQIVLDGFNFVSGSEDAYDLNFQVSALYELF